MSLFLRNGQTHQLVHDEMNGLPHSTRLMGQKKLK